MNRRLSTLEYGVIVVASWILYKGLSKLAHNIRCSIRTTKLRGPKSESLVFGVSRRIAKSDSGNLYEEWVKEYGAVFQIPSSLGSRRTIICDPKAAAHFYAQETYTYRMSTFLREATANFVGKGILYVEGDDHKRLRKAMSPAFSVASVRNYIQVFYDSSYKVKAIWDTLFESSVADDIVVDVEFWISRVSLDSIGIIGFSHDFETLHGKSRTVTDSFEALVMNPAGGWYSYLFLLIPLMPILLKLPNKRKAVLDKYRKMIGGVGQELLTRIRSEKKESGGVKHPASGSILGTLVDAESKSGLSREDVQSQILTLIHAGYETTSVSVTWALVELTKHPEKQARLRKELLELPSDPTYDQMVSGLPYLEAVLREVLRLHPPVRDTTRVAYTDDVIPLSEPVMDASGKLVNSISIARGETVSVSIAALNKMESIWGNDAKQFIPERWLSDEKGIPAKVKELPGYNHILSFVDGGRMCLGRVIAVTEFKAILSVLIRNFEFSFRDGPERSEVENARTPIPRPMLKGEPNISVPLRVRRVEVDKM